MEAFFDWYSGLVGEEFAGLIFVVWIVMFAFSALFMLANYIFSGAAMYILGKRRGLRAYGLAWVPFGWTWLFGSAADQFDRKKKGRDRHFRTWLLILDIIGTVALIAGTVVVLMMLSDILMGITYGDISEVDTLTNLFSAIALYYAFLIPALVFSVLYYIAMYKVYKSCSPKASVWLLLLAIFVNFCGLQASVPLFCLRNKDDGFIEEDPETVAAEQKRLELYN